MVIGGMILVVLAFGLIGLLIANNYALRPKQITYLQNAFRLLETEIAYGLTPLPIALQKVGQKMPLSIQVLFLETERLLNAERQSISKAWQGALGQLAVTSALKENDLEALFYFGQSLGESDLLEQTKNFKLLDEQLKHLYKEAEQEKNKNHRVWQYLGFTFGIALVLVLI